MAHLQDPKTKIAFLTVLTSVLDTIAEQPAGAPSGPMFAACQAQGCTLNQWTSLVNSLMSTGLVTAELDIEQIPVVFHITDDGRSKLAAAKAALSKLKAVAVA